MTFNYPVVALVGTVLLIDTGEETTSGEAVYLSGNGTDAVTFLYIVAEGDRSVDLGTFGGGEIEEDGGLIGTVLRNSDNPTQVRRRLGDLAVTCGRQARRPVRWTMWEGIFPRVYLCKMVRHLPLLAKRIWLIEVATGDSRHSG